LLCAQFLNYLCESSPMFSRSRDDDDGAIVFPDSFENTNRLREISSSSSSSTTETSTVLEIGERSFLKVNKNCRDRVVDGKCREPFPQ